MKGGKTPEKTTLPLTEITLEEELRTRIRNLYSLWGKNIVPEIWFYLERHFPKMKIFLGGLYLIAVFEPPGITKGREMRWRREIHPDGRVSWEPEGPLSDGSSISFPFQLGSVSFAFERTAYIVSIGRKYGENIEYVSWGDITVRYGESGRVAVIGKRNGREVRKTTSSGETSFKDVLEGVIGAMKRK